MLKGSSSFQDKKGEGSEKLQNKFPPRGPEHKSGAALRSFSRIHLPDTGVANGASIVGTMNPAAGRTTATTREKIVLSSLPGVRE